MKKLLLFLSLLLTNLVFGQTVKILFDATKAESAGNADWVIDSDLHNIGYGTGPAVVGSGNESNPQRFPTPAQSGITASTPETYWTGSLSSWGIDCVKRGYSVETLPYNVAITYGNASNPQDLSNYKVFIVCEPNIVFTAAEKTAIMLWVQNGGGLFMVSDHDVSDRNGDGWDSPHIWNDLMSSNSVQNYPFGITFDYANFSETSTNIPSLPADSLLHGPMGNVTSVQWANGTSMTLSTAQNSTVKGVVYKTGSSFGSTNVMAAYARFGAGKVAAIGDSSPPDDGTGDPNDVLYNGWTLDAGGNHERLIMNATIWLATTDAPPLPPAPAASFTASSTSVCAGQAVSLTDNSTNTPTSWSWTMTGGTPSSSTLQNPTVTYNTAGTYTISLVASNSGGSSASFSRTITVNPIPAVTANSQTICNGQSATVTASGASSYSWNTGDLTASITVNPSTTTTYTVTGTTTGCSNTAVSTVTVNSNPPVPTITVAGSVLTSSSATGNQWYLDGVLISGATAQTYTVTAGGTYTVVVTNASGCSSTSAPSNITTTGIESFSVNNIATIFPNPADGIVTVNFINKSEHIVIEVINDLGQVVHSEKINDCPKDCNQIIDMSGFKKGIYLFKIYTDEAIQVKKILLVK